MNTELVKFNERIYYLPYEEENDRPNLYYLYGDNYSIAIDAGNSKKHVEKFYKELTKNGLPLPKITVITHWHWDHSFGLKYINGTSISTKKTHDKLIEVKKWIWTKEEMKKREETKEDIPFCNQYIMVEYENLSDIEVVSTDEYIEEETELDLGGIKVKLIPYASTHCDDGLFVYVKDLDSLFVGDGDSPDFYNGEVYDKEKLIKQMAYYKSLDYTNHFFCHFDVKTKTEILEYLDNELNNI